MLICGPRENYWSTSSIASILFGFPGSGAVSGLSTPSPGSALKDSHIKSVWAELMRQEEADTFAPLTLVWVWSSPELNSLR